MWLVVINIRLLTEPGESSGDKTQHQAKPRAQVWRATLSNLGRMNILSPMKLLRSTLILSFVIINGEFISKSSQVKLKGSEASEVRISDAVTDDEGPRIVAT